MKKKGDERERDRATFFFTLAAHRDNTIIQKAACNVA